MFSYVVVNDDDAPNVELYINWPDRERNLRVFTELETKKQDIERGYGASLSWLPREGEGVACRIAADVPGHSFQKEPGWPQLQDAMIAAMGRLESALAPHLEKYREPDQL